MTEQPPAVPAPGVIAAPARLEPDALGIAQDTVIGMATSGPAVSVGLTLAALASASGYAGPLVLVLTAVPMLVIANACRRCNTWNANSGAAFEWVGRAVHPCLGFITGWLMIAGTLIGTLSPIIVLGPSILAVAGITPTGTWPDVAIATAVSAAMLAVAVAGIRLTARTQVTLGVIEYLILTGFAVAGLAFVLARQAGTYPITHGWFTLAGVGGHGSPAAGFLLAVFIYTGWDGTLYVNEEVRRRRDYPGRAAMAAVALVAVIYTLAQLGLQGVVSPARLQAHSSSALVYTASVLAGSAGARLMAAALALSVTAATGTGIVLTARIAYGMASHRTLPPVLANVSRRFATPVPATLAAGGILIALAWVYLLTASLQNVFTDVIDVTGLLYAAFYVLTALATVVYYRRRILAGAWDAFALGVLPLAAAGFLVWVMATTLQAAPAAQVWSLAGVAAVGVALLGIARFALRSAFFTISRESAQPRR